MSNVEMLQNDALVPDGTSKVTQLPVTRRHSSKTVALERNISARVEAWVAAESWASSVSFCSNSCWSVVMLFWKKKTKGQRCYRRPGTLL